MERQSPPTDRVVRVLNLLAEEPHQPFTLTELAQRLDITKATCLGIVGALVRAGYLVRHPDAKTYRLGPALLALGRAAQDSFVTLEVARPHLQQLTEQFGRSCTVSTVIGTDLVVLERTGLPGSLDHAIQVGQRYPYAPPSGAVFAIWQSDQAIDHWLSAFPPVPLDRNRLQALAQSSRRTGYVVERMSEVSVSSFTLLAGLTASNLSPAVINAFSAIVAAFPDRYYLEDELAREPQLPVSDICTPTYTAQGAPELLLGMFVLGTVSSSDVTEYGLALRDAADAITNQVGGRNPWRTAAVT
jgi:DNA-binding IclR family transcriptional regulator